MKKLYTQMEFTPSVDARVAAALGRISPGGAVGGGRRRGRSVLGLMGMVFGLLEGRYVDEGLLLEAVVFGRAGGDNRASRRC